MAAAWGVPARLAAGQGEGAAQEQGERGGGRVQAPPESGVETDQ